MVRSRRILEIIESDGLMTRAAKAGRYLLDRLADVAAEFPIWCSTFAAEA